MAATKTKPRGLGKGLEALFNDVAIGSGVGKDGNSDGRISEEIFFLDVHKIAPNRNQPRKTFDREKIEELARSIEAHGIIQPIVVTETEKGYEIVAGERRWRAAQTAKLKAVPCIVKELTTEQNMLLALIENMQREDLNPIEEAIAIEKMMTGFEMTQEEISKSVGKSRPYVANALRLLKLPREIQEMISEGKLSGGHGRALAGVKEEGKQRQAAERAIELGWSVREMEAFVGQMEKKQRPKARIKNREVTDLAEELGSILGTKVNLAFGPKRGKIEIEYYSREELERLIDLLRGLN